MNASLNRWLPWTFRARRLTWLVAVAVPVLAVAGASWWFTEPLADRGGRVVAAEPVPEVAPTVVDATPSWPETMLDGPQAKSRLLQVLTVAGERLNEVKTYTATFQKQERIKGHLGPVQRLLMKVRQKPFAVYLKFLSPQAGKEVAVGAEWKGSPVRAVLFSASPAPAPVEPVPVAPVNLHELPARGRVVMGALGMTLRVAA